MLKICRAFSKPSKVIQNQVYNNPFFQIAFPHFGQKLTNYPSSTTTRDWGQSLQQKYKEKPRGDHFQHLELDKLLVQGYRAPGGPIKWMSAQAKAKIHQQIDYKLQQLQDTGLSKQELLYNKPGGLALTEDPVFQYIKNNKIAREMLIKPGQQFTAVKIVDLAIRGDIGPDRSKALGNIPPKFFDQIPENYQEKTRFGHIFPDKIKAQDYYWSEKLDAKLELYKRYIKGNYDFFPKPLLSKAANRKINKRWLDFKDVHWRNTEFLSQFMTSAGQIKNRWQTRLSGRAQKKVSRAIKHAQHLNLFPYTSFILPPHKQNLRHITSDDFNSKVIHAETGEIFARKYQKDVSKTHQISIEKHLSKMDSQEDFTDNFRRMNELIGIQSSFIPSKKELDIIESGQYQKNQEGPGKECAEKIKSNLKEIGSGDIAQAFVLERAYDESILEQVWKKPESNRSLESLCEELDLLKQSFGIPLDKSPRILNELLNNQDDI